MSRLIGRMMRDARGATAIEYGFIVALVVVAIIAAISTLGGATGQMWGNMTTKVVAAEP